ncbi:MAG: hypothetical protein ACFBSD_02370 [Paracoccaceae bacterium]
MSDRAADPTGHAFGVSRPKAWAEVAIGWICAQGLLTLIPIAPGPWGVGFLLISGGAFALMAIRGARLLLRERPIMIVDTTGLSVADTHIPWDDVADYEIGGAGRSLDLRLRDPARTAARLPARRRLGMAVRRRRGRPPLRLDLYPVDARLSDVRAAFRAVRPDLERRP